MATRRTNSSGRKDFQNPSKDIISSSTTHLAPDGRRKSSISSHNTTTQVRSANSTSKHDMIKPDDLVIAVMGVTGVGKSTFISYFCDQVKIGHGLKSCTNTVEAFFCKSSSGKRLVLVDTPGFDDSGSGRTDTDILGEVAIFLGDTYKNNVRLTGIIYLHRISDNKVGGSGLRQMKMFRELCGAPSMANVAIVTTMWSNAPSSDELRREKELQTDDGFFKQMLRNGATYFRQDRRSQSAAAIAASLVAKKQRPIFKIQAEMIDNNKQLGQTAAGQVLEAGFSELRKMHREELQTLKKEMEQALEAKDYKLASEIRSFRADVERKLAQEQESSRKLQQSHADLVKAMQDRHHEEMEQMETLIHRTTKQEQRALEALRQSQRVVKRRDGIRVRRPEDTGPRRYRSQGRHGSCPNCTDFFDNAPGGLDLSLGQPTTVTCASCGRTRRYTWIE